MTSFDFTCCLTPDFRKLYMIQKVTSKPLDNVRHQQHGRCTEN